MKRWRLFARHADKTRRQVVGNEAQGYLMKAHLDGPALVRTLHKAIAQYRAQK